MNTLLKTSLTALAAIAITAGAASAQHQGFRYRDLDLTTEQGVQSLQNRIRNAASQDCASEMSTGSRTSGGVAACERQYRAAALQALPQAARDQIAATQAGRALVSAR